ncbi:MAG: S-layer homology domain-containing protein [Candidatus Ornithomonoglobus sp.]
MKKFIGLVICLAALCCAAVTASAVSYTTAENLAILQILGIGKDLSLDTLQTDKPVTRAAFVNNIAILIKADGAAGENVYYHDVSRDHWAFDTISTLTERGIINGNEAGMFRPDDTIKKSEAVKILESVMGYDYMAAMNGGYPNGYMSIAANLGLLSGCSDSEELTTGDMFRIIVNALGCEVMTIDYGNNNTYKKDKDTTLLSAYYDMYFDDGTLTAADTIDINSSITMPEDQAKIDGVTYLVEQGSYVDYLGCEINFLYRKDDSDLYLLWASPKSTNTVLELDDTYDCDYNSETYKLDYTDKNGKTKHVTLDKGLILVYNGAAVSTNINEILNKDHYDIKLVQTKNSGKYNLAVVWSYENYFVGSIDKDKCIIYDKNNWSRSVCLDESEYKTFELKVGGVVSDFDKITENSIVSVYMSGNGQRVRAEVSSVTTTGTVGSINNSDDKTLKVNGTVYSMYDKRSDIKCSSGDKVTLYFDIKGYIAAIRIETDGSGKFGYIMKAYIDNEGDESFWIKLMDGDGQIQRYKLKDKAKVDGSRLSISQLDSWFNPGGETTQQLVWFNLNESGEISEVDTTVTTDEENPDICFRIYQPEASMMYKYTGKLGYCLLLDNSTKIFAVPSSKSSTATDDDYMIKGKADLINDQSYTTTAYRVGEDDKEYEEAIVIKGRNWAEAPSSSALILVSKIEGGTNHDGSAADVICGFQGVEEVQLTCSSDISLERLDVSKGDAITVEYDRQGDVKSVSKIYDYSNPTRRLDSSINAAQRVVTAYAHDKIGNVIRCGYSSGADYDEAFNLTNVNIIVYDSSSSRVPVRVGTVGDIKTYKMKGRDCSTIIVHTSYGGNPISVIVYNN